MASRLSQGESSYWETVGGPDRDRTGDLFHAMEARSQLRHRPTKGVTSFILLEHAKSVKRSPNLTVSGRNNALLQTTGRIHLPTPRTAGRSARCLVQAGDGQRPGTNHGPAFPGLPVAALRPALANVQTAIGSLGIVHWKASSDVRAAAQQDVVSMQRDLNTTLPGLMAQAEAAISDWAWHPIANLCRVPQSRRPL